MTVGQQQPYVLGHDDAELRRLDAQGEILAPGTRMILSAAGVGPGMRVLDVGAGTGEVSLLAAQLVGPTGSVVGVDRSSDALANAERKGAALGIENTRFEHADLAHYEPDPGYDAVIGRLVLPYLPDPMAAVTSWLQALVPGGVVVAMEYDIAASRTDPPAPLFLTSVDRVAAVFRRAGTAQQLGPRLGRLLADAGGVDPQVIGVCRYLAPDDVRGPALLSGVTASLLPAMEQRGVATAADVDLATLDGRLRDELRAYDAMVTPPPLVGAWARRPL
jgi:SAM-dependent methyltransferase